MSVQWVRETSYGFAKGMWQFISVNGKSVWIADRAAA